MGEGGRQHPLNHTGMCGHKHKIEGYECDFGSLLPAGCGNACLNMGGLTRGSCPLFKIKSILSIVIFFFLNSFISPDIK